MQKVIKMVVGVTVVLFSTTSVAAQVDSSGEGFSGQINSGVILINSGNNLNPSSSKAKIDDLESAAGKELSTVPLLAIDISYSPDSESGLRYKFTTRPPVEEAGSLAFTLGAGFDVNGLAMTEIGLFMAPFGEVWENPYLVDEERQETDNERFGAYFNLKRVLATPLQITAYYLSDDVDDDIIALIEPELARDGELYGVKTSYMIPVTGPQFALLPKASFSRGEYEGGANSSIQYSFGLGARFSKGNMTILPEVSYTNTEYDEQDPLFGVTRNEDKLSARLMVQYAAPFGLTNATANSFFSLSESDSNIDFYQTESLSAGVSFSYRF